MSGVWDWLLLSVESGLGKSVAVWAEGAAGTSSSSRVGHCGVVLGLLNLSFKAFSANCLKGGQRKKGERGKYMNKT